jgi:hypothetical protein
MHKIMLIQRESFQDVQNDCEIQTGSRVWITSIMLISCVVSPARNTTPFVLFEMKKALYLPFFISQTEIMLFP